MILTGEEKAYLEGSHGEANRLAMELLVSLLVETIIGKIPEFGLFIEDLKTIFRKMEKRKVRKDMCFWIYLTKETYDIGENIKGNVLVFPFGKGSTTGSAWFLETIRQGNGPSAVINVETESIIASAIVMARLLYAITIPLVDRLERDISGIITRDTFIHVNGDTGEIRIVSRG